MNKDLLLLVALLICPITMGTMMFFMMRGHNKKDTLGNKLANLIL